MTTTETKEAQPDMGCAVPLELLGPDGQHLWCGAKPAISRHTDWLPTCENHKNFNAGRWDTRTEAPHCDFCSALDPEWVFGSRGALIRGPVTGPTIITPQWWAACHACKLAIGLPGPADRLMGLLDVWARGHQVEMSTMSEDEMMTLGTEMMVFWQGFLDGYDRNEPPRLFSAYDGSLRP